MPGPAVFAMPRQRTRRRAERENAAILGDDYKFTRDPELAAEREQRRRERAAAKGKTWSESYQATWTHCIAPGCKFQTPKELAPGIEFPICSLHAVAVWEHVNQSLDEPWATESMKALRARRDALRLEREALLQEDEAEARGWLNSPDAGGDIYYAQVGELIKVGWTSDLHSRIRAYGPEAVLLVHYPATRRDETNLHRNLAPSRAKGREWYRDDAIVRAFISVAIRQHGQPTITDFGWTAPKPIVAGKRVNRTA